MDIVLKLLEDQPAQVNKIHVAGLLSLRRVLVSGASERMHITFPTIVGDALTGGSGRDILLHGQPYVYLRGKSEEQRWGTHLCFEGVNPARDQIISF